MARCKNDFVQNSWNPAIKMSLSDQTSPVYTNAYKRYPLRNFTRSCVRPWHRWSRSCWESRRPCKPQTLRFARGISRLRYRSLHCYFMIFYVVLFVFIKLPFWHMFEKRDLVTLFDVVLKWFSLVLMGGWVYQMKGQNDWNANAYCIGSCNERWRGILCGRL